MLWALTDHLGSVRDVVDSSGAVLNHIVYDAFGGVTSQTDESVVFRYGLRRGSWMLNLACSITVLDIWIPLLGSLSLKIRLVFKVVILISIGMCLIVQ